jgi:hypothetical protein
MEQHQDLLKFVNEIFFKKGLPKVKNFGKDFSDGSNT